MTKKKTIKKNKIKNKIKTTTKSITDRNILEEIIRVDHAGEYGATRIYEGQLAIFDRNSGISKTIQHIADQEQEHIDTFKKLIISNRVRPTVLLPLWNIAGFALGATTALMGEKAAMACTVAVESVIGNHYKEQAKQLGSDQKKLKATIKKFEKDELEHHDIGLEHEAEKALGSINYILSEEVKKTRAYCRSLFVVKDMKKGEIFSKENIRSIRPGHGLKPKFIDDIIGKKAMKEIKRGSPLNWDLIANSH